MTVPLEHIIHGAYDRLPAGERKLADVVLGMRGALASYSATELADRAGVSKATASRLVRRLGFSDFQAMRREAREGATPGSPLAEMAHAGNGEGALERRLEHDVECLTGTFRRIDPERAERAVSILANAPRVWTVGFRNSYALALLARGLLAQVKPDVRLLPAAGQTVADELAALDPGDAALVVGFRRRPKGFAETLAAIAAAGAGIVLIGDDSLGPLEGSADVVLRCLCRGAGPFDSYVAPVSLINYLCSAVALRLGEAAEGRFRRNELWHERFADLGG